MNAVVKYKKTIVSVDDKVLELNRAQSSIILSAKPAAIGTGHIIGYGHHPASAKFLFKHGLTQSVGLPTKLTDYGERVFKELGGSDGEAPMDIYVEATKLNEAIDEVAEALLRVRQAALQMWEGSDAKQRANALGGLPSLMSAMPMLIHERLASRKVLASRQMRFEPEAPPPCCVKHFSAERLRGEMGLVG